MATLYYPEVDASTNKRLPRASMPLNYGIQTSTLVQAFDSGHEERRQKGAPKRTFEFSYLVLKDTEYATIRDFFLTCQGNVKSFQWQDPVSKIYYTVRFAMDTFVGKNIGHNHKNALYTLDIKLIEAF